MENIRELAKDILKAEKVFCCVKLMYNARPQWIEVVKIDLAMHLLAKDEYSYFWEDDRYLYVGESTDRTVSDTVNILQLALDNLLSKM